MITNGWSTAPSMGPPVVTRSACAEPHAVFDRNRGQRTDPDVLNLGMILLLSLNH